MPANHNPPSGRGQAEPGGAVYFGCCEFVEQRNLVWELSGRFVGWAFFCRFAPISEAPVAAMPGIEKLPLEETLEDSPQVTVVSHGALLNVC